MEKKRKVNHKKNSKQKVSKKKNVKHEVIQNIWKKIYKYFTKKNITYVVLILIDLILVLCFARRNVVHYVKYNGSKRMIGRMRYLLFGRNYINLILTTFMYFYFLGMNRFFLKERNTKKFIILLFCLIIVVNFVLFFLFTKRVF